MAPPLLFGISLLRIYMVVVLLLHRIIYCTKKFPLAVISVSISASIISFAPPVFGFCAA